MNAIARFQKNVLARTLTPITLIMSSLLNVLTNKIKPIPARAGKITQLKKRPCKRYIIPLLPILDSIE